MVFFKGNLLSASVITDDREGDPMWDYNYMRNALRNWHNQKPDWDHARIVCKCMYAGITSSLSSAILCLHL